jgi:hypothetical protein
MMTIMMVILFFIYLHAELNRQWPVTESARIQNNSNMTAQDKANKKQQNKQQKPRKMKQFRLLTLKKEFLHVYL